MVSEHVESTRFDAAASDLEHGELLLVSERAIELAHGNMKETSGDFSGLVVVNSEHGVWGNLRSTHVVRRDIQLAEDLDDATTDHGGLRRIIRTPLRETTAQSNVRIDLLTSLASGRSEHGGLSESLRALCRVAVAHLVSAHAFTRLAHIAVDRRLCRQSPGDETDHWFKKDA